jgi:predicted CoA-binding protein
VERELAEGAMNWRNISTYRPVEGAEGRAVRHDRADMEPTMTVSPHTRQQLTDIYARTQTIAVVGASADPAKPANEIPSYLHDMGYRILPVSPRGGELFGEPVRASLAEIGDGIDVVDVFRPPDEAASVARQAVASGTRVLWFQPGTETDEAVRIATDAGLTVVTGRCMGATHAQLGLDPRVPDPDHASERPSGRPGAAA